MGDKYVFDANIFINLHQRQPRDIYPSVWNKIDELMANGTIISSREVYDELLALAQEQHCVLVTEEVRTNSLNAPKIPNICDAYGVTCINFVSFIREMKLTF